MEVCDFVKSVIDKGEKLSTSMLARLIKFKLLMVKTKDQERRADEKKVRLYCLLTQFRIGRK